MHFFGSNQIVNCLEYSILAQIQICHIEITRDMKYRAVKSLYFGKFSRWHSHDERTFYKVTVDYKVTYRLQFMYRTLWLVTAVVRHLFFFRLLSN